MLVVGRTKKSLKRVARSADLMQAGIPGGSVGRRTKREKSERGGAQEGLQTRCTRKRRAKLHERFAWGAGAKLCQEREAIGGSVISPAVPRRKRSESRRIAWEKDEEVEARRGEWRSKAWSVGGTEKKLE